MKVTILESDSNLDPISGMYTIGMKVDFEKECIQTTLVVTKDISNEVEGMKMIIERLTNSVMQEVESRIKGNIVLPLRYRAYEEIKK